ncbi:hypothetical protein AX15_000565 [Amanita polypyramis BW_CC]|nr:hypothetical protein AX15_000565 [Amanita polypyramis BW_CC]
MTIMVTRVAISLSRILGRRHRHTTSYKMSAAAEATGTTPERVAELLESLADVRERVQTAYSSVSSSQAPLAREPTLVAVSKYKPASDILACFESASQLDFGENYVQELVEKSAVLPRDIRWHFIGTLQSNKAKTLASIPNLYAIQTLTSTKTATALNKSIPPERDTPLRVLIQINTSGEESKSGLPPLSKSIGDTNIDTELTQLAKHVVTECPRLRLEGLMTIGAIDQSHQAAESGENADFERLGETRDVLHQWLTKEFDQLSGSKRWGREEDGRLVLSMGMSSDFEAAIKARSDIVRVGTGIFGRRPPKVM